MQTMYEFHYQISGTGYASKITIGVDTDQDIETEIEQVVKPAIVRRAKAVFIGADTQVINYDVVVIVKAVRATV